MSIQAIMYTTTNLIINSSVILNKQKSICLEGLIKFTTIQKVKEIVE